MNESDIAAKRAYDAAVAEMTDHAIAERVRAYHPHASTSEQAAQAMLDDYKRLIAERDAKPASQSETAVDPVSTKDRPTG